MDVDEEDVDDDELLATGAEATSEDDSTSVSFTLGALLEGLSIVS